MIYLHENGVTVIATNEAKRGNVYELNGQKYYIARSVTDIKSIISSKEHPLNRVITSKLTTLNCLFEIGSYNSPAVPADYDEDISNWDTSNVLSMEDMFSGWVEFNQDISNWDTSRVESMCGMFKSSKYQGSCYLGPTSFNQDISNWDVSNVKKMSEMFLGATSFNQDISNWDVSNVENMDHMFSGATSFNQPIGNWDTSSVGSMRGIFSDVVSIGIVASVGTLEYNRAGSTSFNQDISNWDVSNVKNMDHMFSGATSFNQPIGNWNVSNVENMNHMFSGGRIDALKHTIDNNPTSFNQDISNWDVSNVENMDHMFSGATSFNQPIGNWNVSGVYSMDHMFSGATSFNQDISNWDVSTLYGVENMFYGATSFNAPIGKWKVKHIKNMQNMFREATAFNQDISSWDVSNVTQMKGLFQDATSFNQNIRNWKINEELPKSRTMFKGADAFNIKEYDPFLNKISKERNVDTSTANLSPDDKRTFSKIKKLIITKDTDQIDMAVELITSLNNSSIFKTLLDGCKLIQVESNYSDGGIESKLVTNKLFTGSGPAQPYLNYALMSIIANVPNNDDIQIDDSLKIKNITELNLLSISFKHDYNYCKKPDLSHFIYLRKLTIEDPNNNNHPISIKNISIIKLICKNFSGSLKFLSDLPQLKYLDLDISTYSGDTIQDLESFRDLVNLKELNLESGGKLQNINFLSSCKKLEYLNLSLKDRYSSEFKIDDIEAISDLQNLEELVIGTIEQDFRISHIGECKNLKKLYLKFDDGCVNYDLSELNSCTELTDLKIEGGSPYEINAHVDSINGISQPKNIKAFSIAGNWRNGLKIERLGKEDVTLNDENEIKIVNEDRLSDIGIVSHYKGEPFNGIMYKTTTVPFSNKRVVGEDYEMVDGLKHGSSKCFYNSQNINVKPSIEIYDNTLKSIVDIGAPMLEYKYEDDEFDKIIGFYDQYGNNYVKKDQCVFAKSLSYDSESEKFYFNGNVYSGQVLVHKYASHYRPSQSMGNKMISLYEIIESAEDQEGDFWGGYISFLININDGKLTGEFCAASTSNTFFSGNTNEKGCKNTIDKMMVKKLSSNKSNALTLENKSVVVTGIFENYSRNELKTLITSKGGKPSSSVTSNTFLILGGSKIGPKKKNLANELGIKIIDINSFIEEFINKSEDNNLVNESLFIDVFFPLEAKKEKITTNKLNPEDKKTFTKIKSLLQTRDFDKVDMGIELLRSINITEFYETLLTDCKIINQDSQKVLKNKFFTGSGPAQPYLNYALYLLIYHCPEEAEIDDSLKRNNIKILETDILFNHNYELQYRLPEIEKLTSLNELIIDLKAFDLNKINFSDILKSSSVQKIRILNPEKSLIWLKNLPQLKIMELDNDAFSKTTKDHNVFEYLINLEELKINASRLENIDFLKKCVKIKKLILDLGGKYSSDLVVTKNINTLKYLTDLKELTLTASPGSKNILSYEGLSNCKNLKILDIRANVSDEVLTNIKDCSSLEKIDFLSKADFDIRLNISNLNGLNKLDKLKKIYLDGVNLLESNSKLFVD